MSPLIVHIMWNRGFLPVDYTTCHLPDMIKLNVDYESNPFLKKLRPKSMYGAFTLLSIPTYLVFNFLHNNYYTYYKLVENDYYRRFWPSSLIFILQRKTFTSMEVVISKEASVTCLLASMYYDHSMNDYFHYLTIWLRLI